MTEPERYKMFYGETTDIALERVPDNYEVIQIIPQRNFMSYYVEVVTRLKDRTANESPKSGDSI